MQEVLGVVYPTTAGAADNLALLLNDEFIDGSSEGAASPTAVGPDDGFIYFNGGQKAFLQDSIGGQSNKSVLFSQLSEMFNNNNGGPCSKTSFINSENSGECGGNLVGFSIKGLTNMEFPFAPEKFFKLYNISTNTFIIIVMKPLARCGGFHLIHPLNERVLWFDALVGDFFWWSGRCISGRKASQEKCSQDTTGNQWI